jgi:hypothetical protein
MIRNMDSTGRVMCINCPFVTFITIHTFKSTLPFYLKNVNKLYECKNILLKHIACLDDTNILEMIKYCLSLNLSSFSIELAKDVACRLSKKDMIQIFINLSLSSLSINDIIDFYNFIKLNYHMNTVDLRQLSFLDIENVVSVEGLSKCININNIPRALILYITSDILSHDAITSKDKIQCLSKLSNYRDLLPAEIDIIKEIYATDVLLNGYCIDLLLKQNRFDLLLQSVCEEDWYKKENVHYYELTMDTIIAINEMKGDFGEVMCLFKNKLYLYIAQQSDYKIANDFIKMMCLSDYIYKYKHVTCRLDKILLFIVHELDAVQDHDFYKDCLEFNESICIYGILINMFTCLSAYTDKTYIQINTLMVSFEDKLKDLKKQYPEDHEVWLDAEKIDLLLK